METTACGMQSMSGKHRMVFLTISWALLLYQVNSQVTNAGEGPCVPPIGVNDDTPNALSSVQFKLSESTETGLLPSLVGTVSFIVQKVYEAPQQARVMQLLSISSYNAASSFHPTALDHFGRVEISRRRRRCLGVTNVAVHQSVSQAYAFYLTAVVLVPASRGNIDREMRRHGIEPHLCDRGACEDDRTPWGFGALVAKEVLQFAENDGWNADGHMSRSFNKIPYQDWRSDPYTPRNKVGNLTETTRWQPLTESNGNGYLFSQEHVTPHIGQTGVSILIGDKELCKLQASPPHYDIPKEVYLVLKRTANTAVSDIRKMEIEKFNGKFTSLLSLSLRYLFRTGALFDRFVQVQTDALVFSVIYEATLLVWKEKVRYDLVRPTTAVHNLLGSKYVYTYAGPNKGVDLIPANNWQTYARTMPHSEYPSASACICKAFAVAMADFTGSDEIRVPGDLFFGEAANTIFLEARAGSSSVEPGKTPARDVRLGYSSWSEISEACSRSRLNGGMHFTQAVKAGEDLCAPIGIKLSKAFKDLENGLVPNYVVSPTPKLTERRCS